MNRRQVFSGVAAAATGTATGAFLLSRQGAKRPNFLIVIADDLRWDSIGALGNRAAQTPVLDGLAYRGRVFSNAFVTTSICPTSRASILTGQYGRRHGVWSFDKALTAAQMQQAYPSLLRANGYQPGSSANGGSAMSCRPTRSISSVVFSDRGPTTMPLMVAGIWGTCFESRPWRDYPASRRMIRSA
ncbi:MAG: sulfatase-like hydrolase/transferase [Devosia sp.]|nr:sulfatase-like hydrolase/transferase [Devosia sp.]